MAAGSVRVLINHQDPAVRRRLRQALMTEPDIELVDFEARPPDDGLPQRVGALHPDIILTEHLGDGADGERRLAALRAVPTPARIVLVNGYATGSLPTGPRAQVDQHLEETASRIEILRTVRLAQTPSAYVKYLPSIYTRDEFIGRFLRIFESVLSPVDGQIGSLDSYFDPDLTPDIFLPWLASWLDVTLVDSWTRERKVALLRAAPDLHRWRGTRRGLREHLRLYLDTDPEIEESAGGLRLGPSTQLGFRTTLGDTGARHHFTVTLRVPDPSLLDYTAVSALIEAQKPAHCTYSLVILPRSSQTTTGMPDTLGDQTSPDASATA